MSKLTQVMAEELGWLLRPRNIAMGLLLRALPSGTACRLRSAVYRAFGWRVGAKTLIAGPISLSNPENARKNLTIGEGCFLNALVHIDASGPVTLGDGVSIGHHAVIVTANHEIGPPAFRAGNLSPRPVVVGAGAWIAAGAVILPGVTVGEGAVVGAGAVVTRDVAANSVVAGVPARLVRELTADDARAGSLQITH